MSGKRIGIISDDGTDPGDFVVGGGLNDGADYMQTNRWYRDCLCWKPIDDFRRPHR